MSLTISVISNMNREALFKLWKIRHERYLQKARETLEKNKARYKQ